LHDVKEWESKAEQDAENARSHNLRQRTRKSDIIQVDLDVDDDEAIQQEEEEGIEGEITETPNEDDMEDESMGDSDEDDLPPLETEKSIRHERALVCYSSF
jgi:hypothetical protein